MTYLNGDKYTGQFLGMIKHGNGVWRYSNGDTYTGQWTNDKINGMGSIQLKHTIVDGKFVDGVLTRVHKVITSKAHGLNASLHTTKVVGVSLCALYETIPEALPDSALKNILLIGEIHDHKDTTCSKAILISSWLKRFTIDNSECLDIFVETHFKYIRPSASVSASVSVHTCDLDKFTQTSMYLAQQQRNIRQHQVDFRGIVGTNGIRLLYPFLYIFEHNLMPQIVLNFADRIQRIYEFLITGDENYFADYCQIMAELIKLDPSLTPNAYLDWGRAFIIGMKKRISKLPIGFDYNRFKSILMSVSLKDEMHLSLTRLPMDVYFLTRLFASFNAEKRLNSKSTDVCRERIKNIIVYTGKAHSYFYMNFFNAYYGIDPYYVNETFNYQCIDVPTKFPDADLSADIDM
jgi:hypothetical protein